MSLAPSEHAPATATAVGRGTTDRTGRTRPGRQPNC